MEEQERLTMEFMKSLMEQAYTLIWMDYNDNLDNLPDIDSEMSGSKSREICGKRQTNGTATPNGKLSVRLSAKAEGGMYRLHDFDGEAEVDEFFMNTKTKSGTRFTSRNDSDMVKELVKHTDDIPVRVEMLSNYDCINSNWLESQAVTGTRNPTSGI